jgi:hypothetical protein
LERPKDYRDIRENARHTVIESYDLKLICLPQQLSLLRSVAEGR